MAEEAVCVEILMAVYNGQRFLREQLDSIFAQSWPHWHLTVSDDASTDHSPAILMEYAEKFPDRISVKRNTEGFGSAKKHFFHLMADCDAEYMMFSDQDDVWHTDKVAKTVAAMQQAEKKFGKTPLLVFTDAAPVDESLRQLSPSMMAYQQQDAGSIQDFRKILLQNVVTGCTCMINRSLRVKALRGSEQQGIIMHDWWLAAVAARFGHGVYVPEATMDYRLHGNNQVGAKDFKSIGYTVAQMRKVAWLKSQLQKKKVQALAFLAAYEDALTTEEKAFLNAFGRRKSGFVFYMRHRKLFYGMKRFIGTLIWG